MKNKRLQRVSVMLVTLLSLALLTVSLGGASCGETESPYTTVEDKRFINVPVGGELIAYVQRYKYGEVKGYTRLIDYYLYTQYTGSAKVLEIKANWSISVQFKRRISENYSGNLEIGIEDKKGAIGVSAGSSSEFETLTVSHGITKTTNTTFIDYKTNYTMWPQEDVKAHSLKNTASLKVEGHSNTIVYSAAC